MSGPEPDYEGQIALARDDLDRLVGRLRSLSRLAWMSRRPAVEELLAELEAVTAAAEGRPMRPIPEIVDHALADAVVVLTDDAVAAMTMERRIVSAEALVAMVRRTLDATR